MIFRYLQDWPLLCGSALIWFLTEQAEEECYWASLIQIKLLGTRNPFRSDASTQSWHQVVTVIKGPNAFSYFFSSWCPTMRCGTYSSSRYVTSLGANLADGAPPDSRCNSVLNSDNMNAGCWSLWNLDTGFIHRHLPALPDNNVQLFSIYG